MGSIWIKTFSGGLDTRRLPETSPGGTFILAVDCHLTKGGEVEQRAIFEKVWSAPAGASKGLAADDDNLVIFGHASAAPVGMPTRFVYKHLVAPGNPPLASVPAWDVFGADIVSAPEFGGGGSYLFVDETLVVDVNVPLSPSSVLTADQRVYVGSKTVLHGSKIRDATNFTTTAGFIDQAFELGKSSKVQAVARYENWIAVIFPRDILIWQSDVDFAEWVPAQRLGNIGTFSARGVVPFSDSDLLIYDPTGIRSIRARDSSRAASTIDIGSAIDTETQAAYVAATAEERKLTVGLVDPRTGRTWMAIGDQIFILSSYPAAKITAWSVYRPGFRVDAMVVWDDHIWLRSGDDFYVYGGVADELQYSAAVQAEVWLPYLDAGTPSQQKTIVGVDIASRGVWEVRIGYDPERTDVSDLLGRLEGTTYGHPAIGARGRGTHMGLRFKSLAPLSATEPAVLASALLTHDLDDPKDG